MRHLRNILFRCLQFYTSPPFVVLLKGTDFLFFKKLNCTSLHLKWWFISFYKLKCYFQVLLVINWKDLKSDYHPRSRLTGFTRRKLYSNFSVKGIRAIWEKNFVTISTLKNSCSEIRVLHMKRFIPNGFKTRISR